MASVMPDLRLPSRLQNIAALWLVPNYTACWLRYVCVWMTCPRLLLPDSVAAAVGSIELWWIVSVETSTVDIIGVQCQESGPLCERAMVMNVLDHSFDVMIMKLGVIKRVYCNVSLRYLHLCFRHHFPPDPGFAGSPRFSLWTHRRLVTGRMYFLWANQRHRSTA